MNTAPPTGTIDITDTVEKLRQAWVDWGVAYVFGLEVAIPGWEWVALPIIADIDKAIIRAVLDSLSKSAEMGIFFLNTAIRKASQAKDFTDAVKAKNDLPTTATDEEYKKAEAAQMLAFRNFVMVSN